MLHSQGKASSGAQQGNRQVIDWALKVSSKNEQLDGWTSSYAQA